MHIALDESYRERAGNRFEGHELTYFDGREVTPDFLKSVLAGSEVIGIRWPFPFFLDQTSVAELRATQLVHKSGTGVDSIDVDAMSEQGILIGNNAGINADSVAEHIIMLMLICARQAFWYMRDMRDGRWEQRPAFGESSLLAGKSAGIIGMGNVGCHVAKRLLSFDMNVMAYQRYPSTDLALSADVTWLTIDELLGTADFIIPCVRLTPETKNLISTRELHLMKPTAILVNCSRGEVVDERALYQALVDRRIHMAGIDVFEEEPTPADNPILKLDNVVATPHVAGLAREIQDRQIEAALESIEAFVTGQRPPRLVNPEILRHEALRARHLAESG